MNLNRLEPYLEKLKNLDVKKRLYVFIGLLVFIFLIDYLIFMRPQLNALSKINPEIKLLNDDLKQAKDDISKMNIYRASVNALRKHVEVANAKVTPKVEVPLILENISIIAIEKTC